MKIQNSIPQIIECLGLKKVKINQYKAIIQFKPKVIPMPKKQKQCNNRWEQSPNNSHEAINLDDFFQNPNLNVEKLLNTQNIVEECKKQCQKFTNKLVLHPLILQDLIQICLRPAYFKHQELTQLTTTHTYKALQILNNLSQQFCEYLLPSISQQNNENVITQQQQTEGAIDLFSPLFTQVFKILHDPKPIPETPLWYMYKINTSLCYQKPKHVIRVFKEKKEISMSLFEHFYSNSILEWLIKILQIEDSNSFFEQEKIVIFKYFIENLSEVDRKEQSIELKLNKLENYQVVMATLLQKMQDRFDKTKFINLTKSIYSQKYGIDFVVEALQKRIRRPEQNWQISQIQEQIFKKLITLCQIYFHFGANYKKGIANTIKLNSVDNLKKIDSNNNSNLGIDNQSYDTPYTELNSQIVSKIKNIILLQSRNILKRKRNNLLTLIQFLRLLKTVLMTLQPSQYQLVPIILDFQFIQFLLIQIKTNPKSNILHNLVRDIVIDSVRISYQNTIKILFNTEKCSFMSMISHIKGSKNSGQCQYQNQLYHIFQVVAKMGQKQQKKQKAQYIRKKEGYFQIQQQIKYKESLYNSLICQNPRQQTWGDDEQDEKLLNFSFNNNNNFAYSFNLNNNLNEVVNNKKIQEQKLQSPCTNDFISGNVEHFVQYGLPLDSDESKDQQVYMTGSDVLEKQDMFNYKPIIKLTISGEYDKKQKQSSQLNVQNQLAKKFKNIGVVQCQEQEIRIPIKKQRYGNNKSNSNFSPNAFISLNQNVNFQFNMTTSPKSSPKTSPRNCTIKQNSQKLTVISKDKQRKVQKQGKDNEQIQLEREIRILQNKRMNIQNQSSVDYSKGQEIQHKFKKTVESIQEDGKIQNILPSQNLELTQNTIIDNNLNICGMSELMDLPSDQIQTNVRQQASHKVQSSEIDKDQTVNISRQKIETEFCTTNKQEETDINHIKDSPNKAKSRSSSANKKGGHFPTYLSYQIDQILAQLE